MVYPCISPKRIIRPHEVISVCLSISLDVIIFTERSITAPCQAWSGVITIALGDSVAALVGRRWGKMWWNWPGSHRTLLGSLASLVSQVRSVYIPNSTLDLEHRNCIHCTKTQTFTPNTHVSLTYTTSFKECRQATLDEYSSESTGLLFLRSWVPIPYVYCRDGVMNRHLLGYGTTNIFNSTVYLDSLLILRSMRTTMPI